MTTKQRREEISKYLGSLDVAVSASTLAEKFSVSRQVIVSDIALIRASGAEISATPKGYVMSKKQRRGALRTIACRHDNSSLREELYAVVDNGCTIVDVTVEHPMYGEISGSLEISSRYDADCFCAEIEGGAPPLSALTDGIHLHKISYPNVQALERVLKELTKKGILLDENS